MGAASAPSGNGLSFVGPSLGAATRTEPPRTVKIAGTAASAEAKHSGEEGKIHDSNEAPRAGTVVMHLPSALSTAAASNQPPKRLAPSANSSYSIQIYIFSLCQRQQCIAYKCR